MNIIQKRFLLFLGLCIPLRFLLAYISKIIDKKYLPYLGIAALFPAIGFIIIYLFDYRKTGIEVFGNKIWWNDLRPVHASLYIMFALLALKKNDYSWFPLAIDVLLGLISFIFYHNIIQIK